MGLLAATCMSSCSATPPTVDIRSVVSHPTAAGKYVNGDWEYEHRIWGDTLKHRQGILRYKGKEISRPMGSVISTPLGRFMSFDLKGGQAGYNTGWLMTAFVHDMKRSNVVVPVFMPDRSINPEVMAQLPIKQTDVKEIQIDDR